MKRSWIALLAVFEALASSPAAAQDSAKPMTRAQPGDAIVVEGRRQHSPVREFVRKLTPDHGGGQLGRFVDEVCPAVIGLGKHEAGEVVSRIRQVAHAAGASLARDPCNPNLILFVVHDKRAALEQLRKARSNVFGSLSTADLHRLAEAPGPAAAWQAVERIGADGMPLTWVRVNPDDGPGDAVPVVRGFGNAWRMTLPTVQRFDAAFVMVEVRALDRVDTRQLADYTAMRSLAGTGYQPGELPAPSILGLFDPGASPLQAPESVTSWDFAFLKALYATPNDVEAPVQRGRIGRMMSRELANAPAGRH